MYEHLPFRPLVMFLYMHLLRGGVLDGKPGFHVCTLYALRDLFTDAKVREIRGAPTAYQDDAR